MDTDMPHPVGRFFSFINAMDFVGLASTLTHDVSYHLLMPHPPVIGRDQVIHALTGSLGEADSVRWDIVSWGSRGSLVFVERIDRFFFRGGEAAIECLGIFELRDGRIAAVRDYADLQTWRERKASATAS